MLSVPRFPIKVQTAEGETFTALFKKTGNPKTIRIIAKSRHVTHTIEIPNPKTEVLSWGGFARRALAGFSFVVKNQEGENGKAKGTDAPLQESKPQEEGAGTKLAENSNRVLRGLRSNSVSGPASTPASRLPNPTPLQLSPIIPAIQALPNELYLTAQSEDPKKHYLCRFEGLHKDKVVLQVYFPPPNAEWTRVEVETTYKLRLHSNRKETTMKNKSVPAKPKEEAPVNAPQATTKKGLTVYEAWGKAFEAHAAKPNAPEMIVKAMEASFPGRKTKWEKWVNAVRARYNAGKLPGAAKPKEKIAVYKYEEAPARTGSERRKKDERRTPPLKSVRRKTAPKSEPGPKNMTNAFKLPKKTKKEAVPAA
jgi:hypothetical protein